MPDQSVLSASVISGGCANINVKIIFSEIKPLILRIYLRDREAPYREQKIALVVKKHMTLVPVPEVYIIGEYKGYKYALVEFMQGIPLRDLILDRPFTEWQNVVYDSGKMLALIQSYKFSQAGFFDKDLIVVQPFSKNNDLYFVLNLFNNQKTLGFKAWG